MPNFSVCLTGLNADSEALNTVANNVSNMNTTGYKAKTTSFGDLLYQKMGTTGAGDTVAAGSGVKVAATSTDFTMGTISSTTKASDVAINGSGFFVLNNNGSQMLTRNGSFELSKSGKLESSDGYAVMGYAATNGKLDTSNLTDIAIPTNSTKNASATANFSMTQNLDSDDPVGTSTTGTEKIYDSLGNSYEATITYTKTANNEWSYSMALPETLTASTSTELGTTTANYNFGSSSDTVDTGTNMTISVATDSGTSTITAPTVTAGETIAEYQTALQQALSDAGVTGVTVSLDAGGTGLSISGTGVSVSGSVIQDCTGSSNTSGTLNFDSNGNLVSPSADISKIAFSGLADGASSLDMTWNLYKSSGSGYLTQTASTSTTSAGSQDGYPAGSYSSYSIGSGGEVSVTYSNGENQVVGQLAVAAVSDEEALTSAGSTNYETTAASGSATIGVAGTGGRGTLEGSSLEASNVSVSTEFSNLIIYQRAYEANAKALTTFDTVTQDTINIIRS